MHPILRERLTVPHATAPIVTERELLRGATFELLRQRTEPGLVALYAIRVTPDACELARVTEQRLLAALRPTDIVARLNETDLAVLAGGLLNAPAVFALNDRLLLSLVRPTPRHDGTTAQPRVSGGLALTGNPLRTADDLLRSACRSLAVAERRGGSRIELADPEFAGLLDVTGIGRTDTEV